MSSATAKNRPPGGWRQFCSGPHRALGRTAFGRSCTRTQGPGSIFRGGKLPGPGGPAAGLQSTRARRPGRIPPAPGSRFPESGSIHHLPDARSRIPDPGGRDHFTRTPLRGTHGTIQPFPWNARGTRSPEPGKILPLFNSFYLSRGPVTGSFQLYAILTHN